MNDRHDDDFRIRPNAPKNRGQGFIAKVLKQTGKASSGKSSVRRSGTGHRPGSRLGRGHTAARFAGVKLTPFSRRVSIKTLLVNQCHASPQSLVRHLRYIERDGVGRDDEAGRAYGPLTDEADVREFSFHVARSLAMTLARSAVCVSPASRARFARFSACDCALSVLKFMSAPAGCEVVRDLIMPIEPAGAGSLLSARAA